MGRFRIVAVCGALLELRFGMQTKSKQNRSIQVAINKGTLGVWLSFDV